GYSPKAAVSELFIPFKLRSPHRSGDQNAVTHFRTAMRPAILVFLIYNLALFAGTGLITTVAGTGASGSAGVGGPATAAQLSFPAGLCTDPARHLYIAESHNNLRV